MRSQTGEEKKSKSSHTVDAPKDTLLHCGHDVKGKLRATAAVNMPSRVLPVKTVKIWGYKKNTFLKYTAFLRLQYISLATIVTF